MTKAFVLMLHIFLGVVAYVFVLTVCWTPLSSGVYLTVVALGSVAALVAAKASHRVANAAPGIVFLAFVIGTTLVDISPVQPAGRAVREIRTGMTEQEVRSILHREFRPSWFFRTPSVDVPVKNGWLSFVLDSRDGRYDAAVVEVSFKNRRVATAEFLAD